MNTHNQMCQLNQFTVEPLSTTHYWKRVTTYSGSLQQGFHSNKKIHMRTDIYKLQKNGWLNIGTRLSSSQIPCGSTVNVDKLQNSSKYRQTRHKIKSVCRCTDIHIPEIHKCLINTLNYRNILKSDFRTLVKYIIHLIVIFLL